MILRFLTVSITLIVYFFSTSSAVSRMTAKVAVLPFEVYSDEGADYLRNTIAEGLSLQIATEEQIVMVDQPLIKNLLDSESPFNCNEFTLRKISEKLQAHFLVFGSLTKISENLSLDIYMFNSLGEPPFSKDFVEGKEINSLVREMARKISAKVLLIAGKYPEFQEPEIIAKATTKEAEEERPPVDVRSSLSSPVQIEEEGEGTSHLLPGDLIAEETLVEEVSETRAERREDKDKEIKLSVLPQPEQEETEEQPKDVPKKKSTSSPFTSDKPVKITSHTLEADNKRNKVTFKGNVVAKQEDMVIFSDIMTVQYEKKGGIRRIEASGDVKMTQKDRIATGKEIVFYNPEQKIVMTGNPRIWQDDNLISCEKVTVLLEEDKIFFEGKVDSVIYPKGIKEDKKETEKQVDELPTPPQPQEKEQRAKEKKEPPSQQEVSLKSIHKVEREALQKFILDWMHYWENKDLENYMRCYSKEFTSRGMDWYQWKHYKKRVNDKYHRISLSLSDPHITFKDNQAIASFKQYYQSDDYSDYGMKSLILKKEDGHWKIFVEQWEPL